MYRGAVRCPYCQTADDKVVDSRPSDDGAAIRRAVAHRPVDEAAVAAIAAEIEEELRAEGAEVSSERVGLAVLERLRVLDPVSYLRFASVYKGFEDVTDFEREVAVLQKSTEPKRHPAPSR